MNKADYIRWLAKHDRTLSTTGLARLAAAKFGACSVTYARVIARQRIDGASSADLNYKNKFVAKHGMGPSMHRYHSNQEERTKHDARVRRWRQKNHDRYRAWQRDYNRRRRAEAAHA